MKELSVGIVHEKIIVAEPKHSAMQYGSGLVDVFSTPAMIALMEQTASELLVPYLYNNEVSVGIEVNVKHLKATPIGDTVHCKVEVIEITKNRILFKVEAFDTKGKIGDGFHRRAVIDKQVFMNNI